MFNKGCYKAFKEIKLRLTIAPILKHYHLEYESIIEIDASDGVIAGVFSQKHLNNL